MSAPVLRAALLHMAVLLSMRALPFAAHAAVTSRSASRKLLAIGAYSVLPLASCWLGASGRLAFIYGGLAYYLVVSLGVNPLADLLASRHVTRLPALALIAAAYLFLPGFVFPHAMAQTFLVVGCELALSAYSYCVETSSDRATPRPSLGACLFFLFVNPTLVYTVRGRGGAAPVRSAGWLRAMAGVGVMFANVAWLRPLAHHLRSTSVDTLSSTGALAFLGYGILRFLTIYAAHSGLASIQIGLMRQAGWVVPERYHYPFLATSPLDFWRRWNSYVRIWLEAYIFLPLARHIGRRYTRHATGLIVAIAVTLLGSGAIHSAVVLAESHALASAKSPMEFFAFAGVVVAVWQGAALALGPMVAKMGKGRGDLVFRHFARLVLASVVLGASTRWG